MAQWLGQALLLLLVHAPTSAHAARASIHWKQPLADCFRYEEANATADQRCDALERNVSEVWPASYARASLLQNTTSGLNDPLAEDCQEPANPGRVIMDLFPKIYCCVTVKHKIAEIEEKQRYCDEREYCWSRLANFLPKAMMHYRMVEEELCTPTATTTPPPAAATTTSPGATTIVGAASERTTLTPCFPDDSIPFSIDWCVGECLMKTPDPHLCMPLCRALQEKSRKQFEETLSEQVEWCKTSTTTTTVSTTKELDCAELLKEKETSTTTTKGPCVEEK